MSIEAYQIGVAFVADAKKVTGPVDEMLRSLDRIIERQRDVNMGFTSMVSSLGGARRLASGLASDMERAARAAKDMAAASARFSRGGRRGWDGADAGSGQSSRARNSRSGRSSGPVDAEEMPAPSMLLLPPPARQITYDPSASLRTSTAGMPGNSILGGPGVTVGTPYGPPPPGRPQAGPLLLAAPQGGASAGASAVPGTTMYGPAMPWTHRVRLAGRAVAPYVAPIHSLARTTGPYVALAGVYGGAHGVHSMFTQGAETGDTVEHMRRTYGPGGRLWSDAQISQAQDIALNSVRTVPGASYNGTLEMLSRASGITADAGEALALGPSLARAGQIFAMRGAGPGAVQQIEAAIQSGEVSGLNGANGQLDVEKLKTYIERLSQTAFAMQGTFDLQKYLTGIRQFGVGASGSSLDFLTARLPSIMRVMQESRAGTALSSLDQLMLSPSPNTRNKRYAVEQARLGLRDKSGNVVNRDELIRDPAQWYYSTLVPALSSHGYTERGQIITELSNIFSRSTVQRLGASLSADTALYSREYQRNLAQQAQGNKPLTDYLANAPGAQFSAFTESWRAFESVTSSAMMTPVVSAVHMITQALQEATSYVQSHPDDVRQFGRDVHALVGVMASVAKGIGTVYSYIPANLRKMVLGGVAGAAIGGAGGAAFGGFGAVPGAVAGGLVGSFGGAMSGALDDGDAMKQMIIHNHIHLDGKQIQQSLNRVNTRDAESHGARWDPYSHAPLPGLSPGH